MDRAKLAERRQDGAGDPEGNGDRGNPVRAFHVGAHRRSAGREEGRQASGTVAKKIAKEAAEQAHRNRIPSVDAVRGWKELLQLAAEADAAWFCYEKQDVQELRAQIRAALQGRMGPEAAETGGTHAAARPKLLLIVGPEGGFSEREADEAERAGCRAVSLGKRILRTETAAMVGLTCILYESGEMGGER